MNVNEQTRQFVGFRVGPHRMAMDISQIKEIVPPLPVTEVPKTPAFIEGVIELRGAIIPVVDLRAKFNVPHEDHGHTKSIIAAIEGHIFAFVVDEVTDVIRLPVDQISQAPTLSNQGQILRGVFHYNGGLVLVLDPTGIFSNEERIDLEAIEANPPTAENPG
ncbi:MAG: purine-binding chemotaxis protein CheW [Deltaproteobacteria bacterium]|nr:purine-binding chemotaxis protein CheW [Deltaproteobacteria bacterium]